MHAKQRNPSRIQAQDVAQKGPGCEAKVCLTRPSNPLKTLGPEPPLVCFIQGSNPILTLLPHPRQPCNGRLRPRLAGISGSRKHGLNDACETANPSRIQAQDVAQKGPGCDAKVCLTRPSNPLKTLGPEPPPQTLLPHPRQPCNGRLRPRLAGISGPRKHGLNDACKTAKPQQDSSPRRGPKRSRMRRQGVPNPTFEPVKNTRT